MESHAATGGEALGARTIDAARVRRLVLAYVIASTAFFFVSGLFGMMLRESQADLVRIDPGFFGVSTARFT